MTNNISIFNENKIYKSETRKPVQSNVAFPKDKLEEIKYCMIVEGSFGNSLKVKFKDGGSMYLLLEEGAEYTLGEKLNPEDVRFNIYENTYSSATQKYTFKLI